MKHPRIPHEFQRYEFKYVMPDYMTATIKKSLEHFGMIKDPMVPDGKNSYDITSLYFDNEKLLAYHSKLAGERNRYKLRLRYYGDVKDAPQHSFAEIKSKYNSVIHKRRERISAEDVIALCNGLVPSHKDDAETFQLFVARMKKNSMTPRMLVRYKREPLIWNKDKRLRITFDSHLQSRSSENLYDAGMFHDYMKHRTVMELKFTGWAPGWVGQIIREHRLDRVASSKYCLAVRDASRVGRIRI